MAVVSRIATIVLDAGAGGTRTLVATAATQDTLTGSLVSITITQSTTGATPPPAPDTLTLRMRVDNSATNIRSYTLTPGSASQTVEFTFSADGSGSGAARFGTVRLRLEAVRTSGTAVDNYNVNSDDTAGQVLPTGWTVTQRDQGWVRGTTTYVMTVNKTSLNGEQGSFGGAAFNGVYAYNDTLLARADFQGVAYDTAKTITIGISGIASKSATVADGDADGNYDATISTGVDTFVTPPGGNFARGVTITDIQDASLTGQDFTTAPSNTQTITVNSTVTVGSPNNTDAGGIERVYNRGDAVGCSVTVLNARGEGFTPQGNDTLRVINAGDGAVEENIPYTKTDATGTFTFNFAFATSANNAPASTGGASKLIRWRDTTTPGGTTNEANSPEPASTSQFGLLSSLYDAALHLQIDNNVLDPTLNATQRLATTIGFFSCKITDRNGAAVNGAVGVISFADDGDLVSTKNTGSQTTANRNGHDGYISLQSWTDTLPGGLWDFWFSAQFTKNGNATSRTRLGADTGNFTLLAADPRIAVVAGGGNYTAPRPDLKMRHFSAGTAFQAGLAAVRVDTGKKITIDSAKFALVRLQDSGDNIGKAEYLDADGSTWVLLDDAASAYFHAATEASAGSRVYTKTFSAALTALWGAYDPFIIAKATIDGVDYGSSVQVENLGTANNHESHDFDPVGIFK